MRPLLAAALAAPLLALAAGGAPAAAQSRSPAQPQAQGQGQGQARPAARPATFPTRDVAVTYRVLGNASPQTPRAFTVAVLAAEGRLRVDSPSLPGWGLADRRGGGVDMVMDSMRVVTLAPVRQEEVTRYLRLAETARLTRTGTATAAGQPCTTYGWEERGQRGTVCLTADGVLLNGTNERGEGLEATGVAYGAQDPARFRVPAGYRRMDLGEMARNLGLGLPRR